MDDERRNQQKVRAQFDKNMFNLLTYLEGFPEVT